MNIEGALKNLDNPIQTFEEDLLQRRGFVQSLCGILEAVSPDESNVFALYGEWGSGKTSVKNLLAKELANGGDKTPLPIEFNPWAFSGQDQVMEAFFSEVSKAIGREANGKKAAEGFKKLGGYLSYGAKTVKNIHVGLDLFGIPGSKIVGLIGEQLESGSKEAKEYGGDIGAVSQASLEKVRKDLKDALAKFDRPLLIVLDDLDRLTPDQLLLVFQIVKLNANLPRINYLLLMDPKTITERLEGKGLGPEFIEKIVQFELTLPHVTEEELKAILREGFKFVMGKFAEQIDWERWEASWTNGYQNVFTTLRKIKRFLHTLKFHINLFANEDVLEVDPVDLFSVEVLRKFAPELHAELPRVLADAIYQSRNFMRQMFMHHDSEAKFGQIELERLMGFAPSDLKKEVEHVLRRMFPQIGHGVDDKAGDEWIRTGRICHELFFESYFRLAIPRQLPTQQEIKNLFDSVDDKPRLRNALLELYQKVGLRALLVRIQCHHKRLKPESLPSLLTELWRLDELDAREAGIDRKWDTREANQGITRFFLKAFCAKETRVKLVLDAMQGSGSLYALARFVNNERQALKENPHADTAFDQDQLEELQQATIKAIHEAAEAGSILHSPDGGVLLFIWSHLESKEAVRSWLAQELKHVDKLPRILSRFIFRSTTSDGRETKVHYSISRKSLEAFITLNDELEEKLRSIDISKLPHWEKFAVEETLKRIEDKKTGKQEAEYPE